MDVLSHPDLRHLARRMSHTGRLSYVRMTMQFDAEWDSDLPHVITRIDATESGEDFACLIRDILLAGCNRSPWHTHPGARSVVTAFMAQAIEAFDNVLAPSPDRLVLTLEYLSEGLHSLRRTLCA